MREEASLAVATWMLEHLTPRPNRALSGDLLEEFYSGRSLSWYWRQVISAIGTSFVGQSRTYALPLAFSGGWSVLYPIWQQAMARDAFLQGEFGRWSTLEWPYSALSAVGGAFLPAASFVWLGVFVYLGMRSRSAVRRSPLRILGGLSLSVNVLLYHYAIADGLERSVSASCGAGDLSLDSLPAPLQCSVDPECVFSTFDGISAATKTPQRRLFRRLTAVESSTRFPSVMSASQLRCQAELRQSREDRTLRKLAREDAYGTTEHHPAPPSVDVIRAGRRSSYFHVHGAAAAGEPAADVWDGGPALPDTVGLDADVAGPARKGDLLSPDHDGCSRCRGVDESQAVSKSDCRTSRIFDPCDMAVGGVAAVAGAADA